MDSILSKTSPISPSWPPRLLCNASSYICSATQKIPCLKSALHSDFHGFGVFVERPDEIRPKKSNSGALSAQMSLCIGKAVKWWEKGVQPNMREISSAQELADSLLNSGEKLVVVDFFSPGCGGCKALHPKICQIAEMNPDVQFLQINYEDHKSMCYSLHVHVLPFFRFYRGAHGRLCSFSCTNATIKKFKDALAKHSTERCSLGPPKGLEESELIALAANKDLSFTYTPNPPLQPVEAAPSTPSPLSRPLTPVKEPINSSNHNCTLVSHSGR